MESGRQNYRPTTARFDELLPVGLFDDSMTRSRPGSRFGLDHAYWRLWFPRICCTATIGDWWRSKTSVICCKTGGWPSDQIIGQDYGNTRR